ncbi:MAG TPA: energy transducer TonB [Thermoanaerobaculia bacterium]|nr:energy transducer TonB [Thermoanaerobaculia bacterium]
MNARVACLLLLAACAQETPNKPPSRPVKSAAAVPPAAPRGEHPLDRIPSAPRPDDPVRNPATPPELIKSVPPKYTERARRARIQGVVIVELLIERDGRVSDARVLKPLPMGLDAAARQAVLYWRYEPGRNVRGEPVRTLLHVTVPFRL